MKRLKRLVELVGSFVLTPLYHTPRLTGDLDYIEVVPKATANELEKIVERESALQVEHIATWNNEQLSVRTIVANLSMNETTC